MANVFQYLEYRPLLRDQALETKRSSPGLTLQKISSKAQIQAPYLTNVLKGRAHLSGDQLYALGRIFEWDMEEMDYAQLLLEHERSGLGKRQEHLRGKIESLRREKMKSQAHLKKEVVAHSSEEIQRFFLNPFYSILLAFMGVEKYAQEPKRLARCLSLDLKQIQQWLKDLQNLGFLSLEKGRYQKLKKNFHLPKESPLHDPHYRLFQQMAAQHLQTLPSEEGFNFGITLTADPATREKIVREFLRFLKTIEPWVKEAPPAEVYGLRFDLFRWSFEKGSA